MLDDLNYATIEELCKVKGGKRLPKGAQLLTDPTDHPYIRVRDMGQKYIPVIDLEYVPNDVFPAIKRYIVNEGDVIISIVGSIGFVSIIDESLDNASLTENCAKLSGLSKEDAHYLYYFLNSPQGQYQIYKGTVGAVQPKLPLYSIKALEVIWPRQSRRRAIAHILGTLDDKIELNRKMNESLEQMAQALFKSWFVDFDPVIDKALAAGNEIPEPLQKRAKLREELGDKRKPLPAHIADQFPDSFTFTEELGWIPEGWEVDFIVKGCLKIQNGGTPKRSEDAYWIDGTIPWLTSGEIRDKVLTETENYITEDGLMNSSAKLVPKLTSLVAMYGATAGQVAITDISLSTNQAICALIPKRGYELFNQLNLLVSIQLLENQARGSAQQNISKGIIEQLRILFPSQPILKATNNLLEEYYSKIFLNIRANKELGNLRDTLLPKLISGELRITEAEQLIAEHV